MKKRLFLLCSFLWLAGNLQGQLIQPTTKDNTLLVKGIAILKAVPEQLTVRIDIEAEDAKYGKCQELLIKRIEQTKKLFVKNGIDKESIHTNRLNISEKRIFQGNNAEKIVFAGRGSFLIEHLYSMEYAKRILDGLRNDSLTLHYNLGFSLTEKQKEELRKKAISVALQDASEKAQALANGAEVKLVRINSINFTDTEYGGFSIDSDLVREVELEQQVFSSVGPTGQNNNTIDFNPKEIGIKKIVTVEWLIDAIK